MNAVQLIQVEPLSLATHCPRSGALIAIEAEVHRWAPLEGIQVATFYTPDLNEIVAVVTCPSVTPDEQWVWLGWTVRLDEVHAILAEASAAILTPGVCYASEPSTLRKRLDQAAHVFEANLRWDAYRRRRRPRPKKPRKRPTTG